MATISFLAGINTSPIADLQGSGLGFYGAGGFSASVPVGSWQGRTFITDGGGTTMGPEANNCQYLNSASGVLGQVGSGIALTAIPNAQATLNVRFSNATAVKTQNVQLRIYDRSNIDNAPSGVVCKISECVHPDPVQNNNGSGSTSWQTPAGSGSIMTLTASPGCSGLRPQGAATVDTQHDWYLAISASPSTVGSKSQFGLFCSLEYL